MTNAGTNERKAHHNKGKPMSSILTNNSAMVALETLRNINGNLESVQSQISTGKKIANAKDNASIWAISTVMSSDVEGFKQISDSLNLGASTVGVARNAAEMITEKLTDMKKLIVSAQESNVDRTKIQADIEALTEQVTSIVGAAQFNGLNLVNGTAGASVNVLASLDRSATGVTASSISVATNNLSTGGYTAKAVFEASATGIASTDGDNIAIALDKGGGSDTITISATPTYAAGDTITLRLGEKSASYTVTAEDVGATNTTADLVAVGLKNAVDALNITGLTVDYDSGTAGELVFTNTGTTDLSVTGSFQNANSGGLGALATLDVTSSSNATAALGTIETLIQTSIDAAASFGSSQGRITSQAEFVKSLTDSLTSGIGGLTDADMEATSARLQALQVQQQLGVQALSIANQQPQSLLSLFR
jgi:flagellin